VQHHRPGLIHRPSWEVGLFLLDASKPAAASAAGSFGAAMNGQGRSNLPQVARLVVGALICLCAGLTVRGMAKGALPVSD
jgi:hypothetical protein